jgi:hypothetical protein
LSDAFAAAIAADEVAPGTGVVAGVVVAIGVGEGEVSDRCGVSETLPPLHPTLAQAIAKTAAVRERTLGACMEGSLPEKRQICARSERTECPRTIVV